MAVLEVVVGRQPVFDRKLDVVGYELLFRGLSGNAAETSARAAGLDGDEMTSTVLFGSVSIGMARLTGDKHVFLKGARRQLVGHEPIVLPPGRTVVEVPPSLALDEEVVAGCGQLVRQGFLLGLDHFAGDPGMELLFELASLVKVDAVELPEAAMAELVAHCHAAGKLCVAVHVETPEELERCKDLGFDLFQGYLLSRPRIVPGRTLDVSSIRRLRLAAALIESECGADQLEEIVKAEPAMAYQLLQMAGVGADNGFRRHVRSVREAIVIVGWRQLQSWASFLLLTHQGRTSEEEVVTALTRAKMCELLMAASDPWRAGFAFAAGLLSSFGLLLGQPLEEVLLSLPLDAELHDAVLGADTELGRLVADVVDYQLGRHAHAVRSEIAEEAFHEAATKALEWAVSVSSGFATPGKGLPRPLGVGGEAGASPQRHLAPPRVVRIAGP